jgi:phosphatidylserine/phosphatidylglycerophosphate/cardiolipin synthase-like enzyme
MSRRLTSRLLFCLFAAVLTFQAVFAFAESQVYFSPSGGIQDRLLRAINHTKATIDLAIFDFTAGELAGALLAARERGVVIRVVADARQAQGKHSEIPLLLERGVKVHLVRGNGRGIMHHKFAIFDRKLLVTGSYNWTDSAERSNHEDALVLDNPAIIQRYQAHFEQLFSSAPTLSRRGLR